MLCWRARRQRPIHEAAHFCTKGLLDGHFDVGEFSGHARIAGLERKAPQEMTQSHEKAGDSTAHFFALVGVARWCLAGLGVIMVLKETMDKVLLCLMQKNLQKLVRAFVR